MLEKSEAKPSGAQVALLCHQQGARGMWEVNYWEGSHRQAQKVTWEGTHFISGLNSCQTLGENLVKEAGQLSASHIPAELSLSNCFHTICSDFSHCCLTLNLLQKSEI